MGFAFPGSANRCALQPFSELVLKLDFRQSHLPRLKVNASGGTRAVVRPPFSSKASGQRISASPSFAFPPHPRTVHQGHLVDTVQQPPGDSQHIALHHCRRALAFPTLVIEVTARTRVSSLLNEILSICLLQVAHYSGRRSERP